jgi:general secretion pathway protein C
MRRVYLLLSTLALCACSPREPASDAAAQQAELDATKAKPEQLEQPVVALETEPKQPPVATPTPPADAAPATDASAAAELDALAAATQCKETRCTIPRARWEAALANPTELAKTARLVPATKEGRTIGFKLFGIRPGSIAALLGFQNGDLVTAVAGKPLDGAEAALQVFESLSTVGAEIVVELERKGQATTLTLVIE